MTNKPQRTPIPNMLGFDDNVIAIGDEIEQGLREMRQFEPVRSNLPLPDYVEHAAEVSDVGRLSSQALAAEYERAAKEVEAMGVALVKAMQECEHDAVEAVKAMERVRETTLEAVKMCQATATAYRDEAKKLFDRIQKSAMLAEDVRRVCVQLCQSIEAGEPAARPDKTEDKITE
jgi:hypothetical protein